MDDRDEALSPKAARKFLGVSRSTMVRYAKLGLITEYRTAGGHGRFLMKDLEYLRNNRPKLGRKPTKGSTGNGD